MEQVCPNCGATNRGTSRFCARCGHALPGVASQDTGKSDSSVELPWLQAVQDKAVQSTSSLGPEGADATGPTVVSDKPERLDDDATPHDAREETPQEQPPSTSGASAEAQTPEDEARKDEPPPPWVVSI